MVVAVASGRVRPTEPRVMCAPTHVSDAEKGGASTNGAKHASSNPTLANESACMPATTQS